jgi:uncharacterized protein (TIGR02246 family)
MKSRALLKSGVLFASLALGIGQSAAADTSSIEARLQRLEDREEILALISAYGHALDGRDFHAFAALFAEQGEWIGGLGSAKGPEAIFELMDSSIGHGTLGRGAPSFHIFSNESMAIDGDTARTVTKWVFVMQGEDDAPRWVYLGHYNDELVREDGSWRFLRREAVTDIPGPASVAPQ